MGFRSTVAVLATAAVVAITGASAEIGSECSRPCETSDQCAGTLDSWMYVFGGSAQCVEPGLCATVSNGACDTHYPIAGIEAQDAWTWTQYAPNDHAWSCRNCFSSGCGSLSRDWQAVPGTTLLVRTSDDAALVTGQLRNKDDASAVLEIRAELSGHIFVAAGDSGAPSGSPKNPRAGGPSVNDYHYWTEAAITVNGVAGTVAGASITFARKGPSFQLAVGANDKDSDLGAAMWMDYVDIVSQPTDGACTVRDDGHTIDINLDLTPACVHSRPCDSPPVLPPPVRECVASRAIPSPDTCTRGGGHALTLAGIGSMTFKDGSGRWQEFADGTAAVTGVVTDTIDGKTADFDAYYVLTRRIKEPQLCSGPPEFVPETGAGYCSAKRELWNSNSDRQIRDCYSEHGGPVDVSQWDMYLEVTEGSLRGVAGSATEGYTLELKMRGPGFQVGVGAGGKSIAFGASGWVSWKTTAFGSGFPTLDGASSYRSGDWNIEDRKSVV